MANAVRRSSTVPNIVPAGGNKFLGSRAFGSKSFSAQKSPMRAFPPSKFGRSNAFKSSSFGSSFGVRKQPRPFSAAPKWGRAST